MSEITILGLDLAKSVFEVHGADARGQVVLRKKLRRAQVLDFFATPQHCAVAIKARISGVGIWPSSAMTSGSLRLPK